MKAAHLVYEIRARQSPAPKLCRPSLGVLDTLAPVIPLNENSVLVRPEDYVGRGSEPESSVRLLTHWPASTSKFISSSDIPLASRDWHPFTQ